MDGKRPELGEPIVLVYRECPEGCWCATGEGDVAPLCATHEEPMLPLDSRGGRADSKRLGFVGELMPEAEVVRRVIDARRIEGLMIVGGGS